MKRGHDVRRLLRWYPSSWRARYGEEFLSLLEDRLGGSSLTFRFRLSVAIAGLRERCNGAGVVGTRSSLSTQRRTGALMVLIAWSIMVVGGAGLAKTAEHFAMAMPVRSRFVAHFAYSTTAVAGIVGTLLVAGGVLVATPGFVRLLRAQHGSALRGRFAWPLVASVVLIIATVGLSSWAHSLNVAQRNGGDHLYSGAFLTYALLVVVTLGLWTRAGVTIARKIDFTERALRWESWLAVGVSLASVAVIGSTALWWIQMGLHAPWFLQGTATGTATSPWSAQLVVIVLVMALATATALWGASRVALTYLPTRWSARLEAR